MPEGVMNLAKVLNIYPTNLSRVQFPMAIVPPGLHTRSSSRATSSGRGANITPTKLLTTSKLASSTLSIYS